MKLRCPILPQPAETNSSKCQYVLHEFILEGTDILTVNY